MVWHLAGPAKEEVATGDTSIEEAAPVAASQPDEEPAITSTQTEDPTPSPTPPAESPATTPIQAQDGDKEKNDITTTEPGIACPHLWRVRLCTSLHKGLCFVSLEVVQV